MNIGFDLGFDLFLTENWTVGNRKIQQFRNQLPNGSRIWPPEQLNLEIYTTEGLESATKLRK